MSRVRNEVLAAWMAEHGITAHELAGQLNTAIRAFTGTYGSTDKRVVFRWLSGEATWPNAKQRKALEQVTGRTAAQLGFRRKGTVPDAPAPLEEDPVRRREFITATTGTALGAVPVPAVAHRVGTGDVERLQAKFAGLVASDHRHGGRPDIENHASALADEALALQQRGSASQRIRSSLYSTAAAFTSSSMWAAIDGRRFDTAEAHLHQAVTLAGLAGDPAIQFRIWSHAGTLYRHLARATDALAANDVARALAVTRRDPMFASLGHARHAAILGLTADTTAVRRALGHAQDALDRAEPAAQRPLWLTAFYGQSELESLSLAAYLSLGDYARAETHARSCLDLLPGHMHRSRAIATARLSLAQLGHGDLDTAVITAMSIPTDASTSHPRVVGILSRFGRTLAALAPDSESARTWDEYTHANRRNPI
ncbi:XRE family transcriptional regulator [Actinacidiphila oryziradicis]|uniref:XRE family transcriptional regulator n=1 Tax=Actinacidiphila oryziradicis TaxID=2571141 RepID=A0A4U0SVH7_9ACTN|nr:XRE family transcriptional regulator [Actinacidiphila oryziradicis]TKA12077.1 XRE family transcriptional regulator [Actinacidiphila oryziradicis]